MRELITPRAPDSHKGDYGRVLIVAGSRGKTGAAHLAAVGALRTSAAEHYVRLTKLKTRLAKLEES